MSGGAILNANIGEENLSAKGIMWIRLEKNTKKITNIFGID